MCVDRELSALSPNATLPDRPSCIVSVRDEIQKTTQTQTQTHTQTHADIETDTETDTYKNTNTDTDADIPPALQRELVSVKLSS